MKAGKSISIFGMGSVGLSQAVCLASRGYNVIGVDTVEEKVEAINRYQSYIFEPGLDHLLRESIDRGFLHATLDYRKAILDTDVTFIAVGTPSMEDGRLNLQYIKRSAETIADILKIKESFHLVVVKSTVTPGTTERIIKPIIENGSGKRCGSRWGLCVNPEFLREGSAIKDTLEPDRIIIGESDKNSGDMLNSLYGDLYDPHLPPVIRTNWTTAELIKYTNNAFLATKVSFINSIANLCQKISGADVNVIADGIGVDKRIGRLFLNAGLGWGGSCFPKDLRELTAYAQSIGVELPIVEAASRVNRGQPLQGVNLARKLLGDLRGKRFSILGLSFKPDTDDLREAPSIKIIQALINAGAKVVAHDPKALNNARRIFGDLIEYEENVLACLRDSDCCILVTEWDEYRSISADDFRNNMHRPVVIDGRRIYDPVKFVSIDLTLVGLGPTERN